jgi:hypothetical protein
VAVHENFDEASNGSTSRSCYTVLSEQRGVMNTDTGEETIAQVFFEWLDIRRAGWARS